ncbi:MAG: transposase, partial [Anaerotignum sp.]
MSTFRKYDDEFKKMAIKLIIEDGRKITNVSDELGVS